MNSRRTNKLVLKLKFISPFNINISNNPFNKHQKSNQKSILHLILMLEQLICCSWVECRLGWEREVVRKHLIIETHIEISRIIWTSHLHGRVEEIGNSAEKMSVLWKHFHIDIFAYLARNMIRIMDGGVELWGQSRKINADRTLVIHLFITTTERDEFAFGTNRASLLKQKANDQSERRHLCADEIEISNVEQNFFCSFLSFAIMTQRHVNWC